MTSSSSDSSGPSSRRAGHWSRRTKARKAALDVLFESDLRGVDPLVTLGGSTPRDYTEELVRGVVDHRAEIDARLTAALHDGWTLQRMPRVDRALARIAIYEMDHGGIAPRVAIAEALILAGDLSTDESPAFLNGVLSAAARTPPLDENTVLAVHEAEASSEADPRQ